MASTSFSLDMAAVRQAIQYRAPQQLEATCRASVVLILHPTSDGEVELMLICRSLRDGDPWSGHMGLPGGHRHENDEDDRGTALRETLEEVGLDLTVTGDFVGRLDDLRATAGGRVMDLVISPFVYQVGASPNLVLSDEVSDVIWVPLGSLASGANFLCHSVEIQGKKRHLPAWSVGPYVVWGLTYRMISGLLGLVLSMTD